MMGIKGYQEKIFYNFSLSSKVPEDHLLRHVEKTVDLCFVRELVADKYSHTGQRSIDPVIVFKMMLIGYFYGITSERRLAEDVSMNLAYMWYLGYDLDEPTPNHSVLSKARSRYGREVFETFFNRILEQCVKAGLVSGEKVFADSTYIHADASLKSLVLRPEFIEPSLSSKEFVEKVFAENPLESDSPDKNQEPPNQDSQKGTGEQRQSFSNKTHISKTDPESAVVSHGQKLPLQLAYKEHFTVDSQARVITAVEVTSAAIGDESQLAVLIEQQPVAVQEICADTKYGTFENYAYLIRQGILPSISPWSPGSPSKKENRFKLNQFTYNYITDTYTCPAGKTLMCGAKTLHYNCFTYHGKKRECKACSLRTQCISPRISCKHIFRNSLQEFKDKALVHLQTKHAQHTIRQRKSYAEWVNAESKTRHGLRRAMFRGLDKVTIQVLMTASVQNIKRLISHIPSPSSSIKELFV